MLNRSQTWGCALALALLTGCGGGLDASNSDDIPNANATLSFEEVQTSTTTDLVTFKAATKRVAFGARAHLSDVDTQPDLTGVGVWINVIDDFQSSIQSVIRFPAINRLKTTQSTSGGKTTYTEDVCSLIYEWSTSWTHGDLVSSIAGETVPAQSKWLPLTVATSSFNPACAGTFYTDSPASALVAKLDVAAIPGVASGASVLKTHVFLGATAAPQDLLRTIQGHFRNAATSTNIDVINLSRDSDIDASGKTVDEMLLVGLPVGQKTNAVITVAAGNSAKPCGQTDLHGCNVVAAVLANQADTQDETLVVGALTGTGSAQKIAGYSTRPGFLMARFIWASGDTGFYPDANGKPAARTSFAAARVAGVAALLRQKYPNLTGAQIANLILLSADRDMNNDGVPDFTGVDPEFGNGKLSLKNALKLAAGLYP